jgi:hypothetical protein
MLLMDLYYSILQTSPTYIVKLTGNDSTMKQAVRLSAAYSAKRAGLFNDFSNTIELKVQLYYEEIQHEQ